MPAMFTDEIDLGEEKTERLITLLKAVESADSPGDAVYLAEEDRQLVGEIRTDIEDQTGRSN